MNAHLYRCVVEDTLSRSIVPIDLIDIVVVCSSRNPQDLSSAAGPCIACMHSDILMLEDMIDSRILDLEPH